MKMTGQVWAVMLIATFILGSAKAGNEKSSAKKWLDRPGLGIMYMMERREGWNWERDFVKFNKSMTDENGSLKFNGPYCQANDWVELSRKVGVDYHVIETKWHDGICYFNTGLTSWKTPVDYVGQFSELSRQAGIPYLFYYSSLIDHNPNFDRLQPLPRNTLSMIGLAPGNAYQDYMLGQYKELVEQYHPDGFWLDWFSTWPDRTSSASLKFLRQNYPDLVVTFNASSGFPRNGARLTYTTGEAHDLRGSKDRSPGLAGIVTSLNSYCFRDANKNRAEFDHPWELISPCGKDWQVTALREDLNELARMTAATLANGGKHLIGAATGMDGAVLPEHVRQLEVVSAWYQPRRELFQNAVALKYAGDRAPGVSGVDHSSFGTVAAALGEDRLLHLINFNGSKAEVKLRLGGVDWGQFGKAYLEPGRREIAVRKTRGRMEITLDPSVIDPVDTIIRLEKSK